MSRIRGFSLVLVLLVVALVPAWAGAAIVEVQAPAIKDTASTTSDTLAYASSVTAGSLLITAHRIGDADGDKTEAVSDDVNGAWTKATGIFDTGAGEVNIWYFPNSGAGAITVTTSFGGAATSLRWSIHEYSGIATASPLDQVAAAVGNSTTPASGAVTTTQADELLFAATGANGLETYTAGAGYTLRAEVPAAPNSRMAAEHQIVSATGTYDGTFTQDAAQAWQAAIATFKAAAGGAAATPSRTLLGVGQ